MDDEADEENRKLSKKPRLVIIGGGWGVSLSLRCIYALFIGCRV